MKGKDESRRPPPSKPKPARKEQKPGQAEDLPGAEEKMDEVDTKPRGPEERKVATHIAIIQASVYHVGVSIIARPSLSEYIPTAYNMFTMLLHMAELLAENTYLHEICPDFFSPSLYLYYSHVVYFQILRARQAAGPGILTRLEKRILTNYERIGPAEAWPIAAPLIGFVQALGCHKPADTYYSWIVPKLPDFSQFGANAGLTNLAAVTGMLRLPIVPAYQKLLRNFGSNTARYQNGSLNPQPTVDAGNTFIGIGATTSTTAPFVSLTNNLCWIPAAETGQDYGIIKTAVKRARIGRYNVPDRADNVSLDNVENFLGFDPNHSFNWMAMPVKIASIVNRFFPGSTNLSQIPPMTTLSTYTHVVMSRTAPTLADGTWYYKREGIKEAFYGFSNTEEGVLETRLGLGFAVNSEFTADFFGSGVANADPARSGPFFLDDPNRVATRERNATFLNEGSDEDDTTLRYSELLTQYFDHTGGKA